MRKSAQKIHSAFCFLGSCFTINWALSAALLAVFTVAPTSLKAQFSDIAGDMGSEFSGFASGLGGSRNEDARWTMGFSYLLPQDKEDDVGKKDNGLILGVGGRGRLDDYFTQQVLLEFGVINFNEASRFGYDPNESGSVNDTQAALFGGDYKLFFYPTQSQLMGIYLGAGMGIVALDDEDSGIDGSDFTYSLSAGLQLKIQDAFSIYGGLRHQEIDLSIPESSSVTGQNIDLMEPTLFWEAGFALYW